VKKGSYGGAYRSSTFGSKSILVEAKPTGEILLRRRFLIDAWLTSSGRRPVRVISAAPMKLSSHRKTSRRSHDQSASGANWAGAFRRRETLTTKCRLSESATFQRCFHLADAKVPGPPSLPAVGFPASIRLQHCDVQGIDLVAKTARANVKKSHARIDGGAGSRARAPRELRVQRLPTSRHLRRIARCPSPFAARGRGPAGFHSRYDSFHSQVAISACTAKATREIRSRTHLHLEPQQETRDEGLQRHL